MYDFVQLHKISIHFCSYNHPTYKALIKELHSTLIEHVLNSWGFTKTLIEHTNCNLILAYNHICPHNKYSIIYDNPFVINFDEILINDYISHQNDQTRILYPKLYENWINTKTNTNTKKKNRMTFRFLSRTNKAANKYGK